MTASQNLPTLARLINELDGSYPGLSLLTIVTRLMSWEMESTTASGDILEWSFEGKGEGGLAGSFSIKTGPSFHGFRNKGLSLKSTLKIQIPDGRSRSLQVTARRGDPFGRGLVYLSSCGENFEFPIAGYPHPIEKDGHMRKSVQEYIKEFKLPEGKSGLLAGATDGHVFLALMALELYLEEGDMQAHLDTRTFSLEDLSARLENAMRHTKWGD